MSRKYWVPALGKAHQILAEICRQPSSLKLIDLSRKLDIHKSSMFSLLQTMEELQWVRKENDDTYAPGPVLGMWGSAYFQHFDLTAGFRREALLSRDRVGETVQMARREGSDCVYLAKVEAPSPVRLHSEPGMRLPCHATALGKMLLSALNEEELMGLYPDPDLPRMTPNTLKTREALTRQLARIRERGYSCEEEEAAEGFCCTAAPVYGASGEMIAAVSFSVPVSRWPEKKELAQEEIRRLGKRLSVHGIESSSAKG